MGQNVPPLKAAQNISANIAAFTASPTKATPPRPPSNRLNRKASTASTDLASGQKSPRRTGSGLDGKAQGGATGKWPAEPICLFVESWTNKPETA